MAMVDKADITVTDAILHLLDPTGDGFTPSERALPAPRKAIDDFLAGHIANALSDSQIKGGRFVSFSADTAPGILQRLVAGHNFVPDSQILAQSAYQLMASDKRIKPPGSLAVVRYLAASIPGVNHVAALKLDKGGRFRWFLRNKTGPAYWDLEETSDVAPSNEERLHKAVFVGPIPQAALTGLGSSSTAPKGGGTHQFLVLDRQVKGGADWWLAKFLVATPAYTDDERAEKWIKGALAGKSKVQRHLTEDQRNALDSAIRTAIDSDTVNVNEWLQTLYMPDYLKTDVRAEIDARLPDNMFTITDAIRKKYAKRTWVGDYGLRVTIDASYTSKVTQNQTGKEWVITIHTSRWDPVP